MTGAGHNPSLASGEPAHTGSAEGATAPETLRHTGPMHAMQITASHTLKSGRFVARPTAGASGLAVFQPMNLSGSKQRGPSAGTSCAGGCHLLVDMHESDQKHVVLTFTGLARPRAWRQARAGPADFSGPAAAAG